MGYEITDDMLLRHLPFNPRYSKRLVNCLELNGIVNAGKARDADDRELLRIPNFGRKALAELRRLVGKRSAFVEQYKANIAYLTKQHGHRLRLERIRDELTDVEILNRMLLANHNS